MQREKPLRKAFPPAQNGGSQATTILVASKLRSSSRESETLHKTYVQRQ